MSKRFIIGILAAAIAVTAFSAQPVRAGNDRLGQLLVGVAALVVLGTALEASRRQDDDKKKKKKTKPTPHHVQKPAPQPNAHRPALLPEYCLRRVRDHEGPRIIYGNRCMKANYPAFERLPQSCRTRIDGPNGVRRGFRPGCLYRAGFRG